MGDNLSSFWSFLTWRVLYLFMKLCKRLESNINPKEIKYLSIILSSKLRKLYKLNFPRILNVIKLDMPWLNILLLSISGWINSVKMNSFLIFISELPGDFLFCVLESCPYFQQFFTENKVWLESTDVTKIYWKLKGTPQICVLAPALSGSCIKLQGNLCTVWSWGFLYSTCEDCYCWTLLPPWLTRYLFGEKILTRALIQLSTCHTTFTILVSFLSMSDSNVSEWVK